MSNFLLKSPHCVHIHLPKTGGSTIRIGLWEKNYVGPVFGEIPDEWASYFKFAFVRHPLDRFMSAYRDFTQIRRYRGSVEDFASIVTDTSIPHERVVGGTAAQNIRHHTVPQTDPSLCLKHADLIGRYENFHEDLRNILKTVGKASQSVPHLRKTESAHWSKILKKPLRERLCEFFKEDFEVLGYDPTTDSESYQEIKSFKH